MCIGNPLLQNLPYFSGFSDWIEVVTVFCSLPLRHPKGWPALRKSHQPGHECVADLSPLVCGNGCCGRSLVFMMSHLYSCSISWWLKAKSEDWGGERYTLRIIGDQIYIEVHRRTRYSPFHCFYYGWKAGRLVSILRLKSGTVVTHRLLDFFF